MNYDDKLNMLRAGTVGSFMGLAVALERNPDSPSMHKIVCEMLRDTANRYRAARTLLEQNGNEESTSGNRIQGS